MFTGDAFFYAEAIELDALEPDSPVPIFGDLPETKSRALWLAVIEDAIRLYVRKPGPKHADREDYLDVVGWIEAPLRVEWDADGRPTFAAVCELFAFDAGWIRSRLMALAASDVRRIPSASQRARQATEPTAIVIDLARRRADAERRRRARKRVGGVCILCNERAVPGFASCAFHRAHRSVRTLAPRERMALP